MKNLRLVVTLLCFLSVALTGCCESGVVPTPVPVTITFAYPSSDTDAYQLLVEAFNETYPYITIELYPMRRSNSDLDMETIDVAIGTQHRAIELRESGDVLDLSPILDRQHPAR